MQYFPLSPFLSIYSIAGPVSVIYGSATSEKVYKRALNARMDVGSAESTSKDMELSDPYKPCALSLMHTIVYETIIIINM